MKSIAIILVHNQNPARLKSARQIVGSVAQVFRCAGWTVDVGEVFEQPELKALKRAPAAWIRMSENLAQALYCLTNELLPLRQGVAHLLAGIYAPFHAAMSKNLRLRMRIDSFISRKHYRAWSVGSNHDFVLIMEDDVVVLREPTAFLNNLRGILEKQGEGLFFADLAGGFDQKLAKWPRNLADDGFWELSQLTTNTACAYIVNAELARRFTELFVRSRTASQFGIDFFMNWSFVLSQSRAQSCFHASENAPFRHGSMLGTYKSWDVSRS